MIKTSGQNKSVTIQLGIVCELGFILTSSSKPYISIPVRYKWSVGTYLYQGQAAIADEVMSM